MRERRVKGAIGAGIVILLIIIGISRVKFQSVYDFQREAENKAAELAVSTEGLAGEALKSEDEAESTGIDGVQYDDRLPVLSEDVAGSTGIGGTNVSGNGFRQGSDGTNDLKSGNGQVGANDDKGGRKAESNGADSTNASGTGNSRDGAGKSVTESGADNKNVSGTEGNQNREGKATVKSKTTRKNAQGTGNARKKTEKATTSTKTIGKKAQETGDDARKGSGKATSNNDSNCNDGTEKGKAQEGSDSEKDNDRLIRCSIEIVCPSLVKNAQAADESIQQYIPEDGNVLKMISVSVKQNSTVYELLSDVCQAEGIPMDAVYTPLYSSYYVRGIGHLYEKQAGDMSGWIYMVNGQSPNKGVSYYKLKDGDQVSFRYTCDGRTS